MTRRLPRNQYLFLVLSLAAVATPLHGQADRASVRFMSVDDLINAEAVAALNVDNAARNRPDALFAIGRQDSDLGVALDRVMKTHPELGVTTLLDLQPGQEAFYYRSDHYSFARRGVPALFFSTGIHADYHQVSDEVERVDADKAARIGRLLLHLGRDLADADTRPHWEPASFARIVGPPE